MVASINGQADVIRVLLDAGADQTIEDRYMVRRGCAPTGGFTTGSSTGRDTAARRIELDFATPASPVRLR
jgi:hypothetical protein